MDGVVLTQNQGTIHIGQHVLNVASENIRVEPAALFNCNNTLVLLGEFRPIWCVATNRLRVFSHRLQTVVIRPGYGWPSPCYRHLPADVPTR